MRIIINELKKIFNWKSTLVLVFVSLMIYKFLPGFYIDTFPNGRPSIDIYRVTYEMINKYGNDMDAEEFEDLKLIHKEKIKEADEYFKNNEGFNKFGVYSYDDYLTVQEKYFYNPSQEYTDFKWEFLDSEEGNIAWELQELPNIIERYEDRNNHEYYSFYNGAEKRINEIVSNDEGASILPYDVFENYNELIKGFAVMIIIGVVYMLTPIFLKDKENKLEYIQYSSKVGRNLFKKKLIAGFIAAMIITTLNIVIMALLYGGNNTSDFFNSNINSFLNGYKFWFNITFIKYIVLTIICIYIISIITALISMYISSKVSRFVEGIGVQVPVTFILILLSYNLFVNNIGAMYIPKYFTLIVYIGFIVAITLVIFKSMTKEGKREV